ncbi:endonuclease domain-containing protein [Streptomyces swartbergensis]|uniref:endonuclease domain-containing protein n=1 Tax=Streptomyces swartbergensis TaxID=487165 RepID=UPI001302DC3D
MIPLDSSAQPASPRRTETRHHPEGSTCHHFTFHRLTCDEYDQLRARAAGRCELCTTPESETGGRRLVVDHFWDAGTEVRFVRGLLCDRCNAVMACFDERKAWGVASRQWEDAARNYEARSFQQPTAEAWSLVSEVRKARRARRERMRPTRSEPARLASSDGRLDASVRIPLDRPSDAAAALRAAMTADQLAALIAALQSSQSEAA